MEFWKQWDLPLWNNLDVLGNMDEEVWEITKMIILSDCHTQSEDFSPRIRKKLEMLFNEDKSQTI